MKTTLNKIRACSPCKDGWNKLLKHLGKTKADDEPLPFEVILDSNGLNDALWCCRSAPEYSREWRLFAVWCASQVKHLMKDQRSLNALEIAEKFANGAASNDELAAARAASAAARDASAAARAAINAVRDAASDAAWAAAWAAINAAWDAAINAAWDAASAAASDAAWAAAWAAINAAWDAAINAAWDAASDAARDAASDAARAAQKDCFRWVVNGGLHKFEKGE